MKIFVFLFVMVVVTISLSMAFPWKISIKPFIVLSGSMKPAIWEGSVAFVKRGTEGIKKGDIITFIRPTNFKENVTHRVVEVQDINGKITYKTKGDANKEADQWVVKKETIWGKFLFALPLLGYVVSFSKTRLGVILIVALPLIIISFDEFRIIYREIKKRRVADKNGKIA